MDEAMFQAVKEFTKHEMKVPSEVFDAMKIEKIFPPAKESWNTLYIQFAAESSVKTLYRYTRDMQNSQRLVPYIPKVLYPTYKELKELAFTLRHSDIRYKTRMLIGETDLILYKRKPEDKKWVPVTLEKSCRNPLISSTSTMPASISISPDPAHLNLRPQSAFTAGKQAQGRK